VLHSKSLVAFVACRDLEAAESFYGSLLGLPVEQRTPFAVVFDAHGTQLRVTKVETVDARPYTVLGWRVNDISHAVGQLRDRGVRFSFYEGMAQNDDGVWNAPSGTRVAWFSDPDGNTLSLQQDPPDGLTAS
jgi:catechol 2,3-dioxygenase-like lactoylglutathione lyase family enzyme